ILRLQAPFGPHFSSPRSGRSHREFCQSVLTASKIERCRWPLIARRAVLLEGCERPNRQNHWAVQGKETDAALENDGCDNKNEGRSRCLAAQEAPAACAPCGP